METELSDLQQVVVTWDRHRLTNLLYGYALILGRPPTEVETERFLSHLWNSMAIALMFDQACEGEILLGLDRDGELFALLPEMRVDIAELHEQLAAAIDAWDPVVYLDPDVWGGI